jgi:hypothetical protein
LSTYILVVDPMSKTCSAGNFAATSAPGVSSWGSPPRPRRLSSAQRRSPLAASRQCWSHRGRSCPAPDALCYRARFHGCGKVRYGRWLLLIDGNDVRNWTRYSGTRQNRSAQVWSRASYSGEPNCPDGVAGLHNDWEAANDPWNAIDDSSLGHAGHRRIPEPR